MNVTKNYIKRLRFDKNILIGVLIALGLSRPLMFFFTLQPNPFIEQFLVSPLPLVFDNNLYFSNYTLSVTDKNNQVYKYKLDRKLHNKVQGPLSRIEVYTHGVSFAPLQPPGLRDRIFRYAYCSPGYWAKWFDLPEDRKSVTMSIFHQSRSQKINFSYGVNCYENL